MKKAIIIILILINVVAKAQTFNTYADTANYLITSIENNKAFFIGKPFSVLYDSLKIKPVKVIPSYTYTSTNDITKFGNELLFDCNYSKDGSYAHWFVISFIAFPSYNIVYPMFYPRETSSPISDIINLYKPYIVKDIVLKDYQEDEPAHPNVILHSDSQPNIPPIPGHWIVTSCTYKKVLIDGLYQWRYEIIKKFCENGTTGTAPDITYATTSQAVENCVVGAGAE